MTGLLSGLLGGGDGERKPWQGARNLMQGQPSPLAMMGMSMLADNSPNSMQSGMQALMMGGQMQRQRQEDALKTKTQMQTRNKTSDWLRGQGFNDVDIEAATANPAIMKQLLGSVGKSSAPEAPKIVEFFDERTGQPVKAQWNAQSGEYERIGGVKMPSNGITIGADGSMQIGGPAGQKPMKEIEAKANLFASRMEAANQVLGELEEQGLDLGNKLAGNIPLGLGNYAHSPEFRQYDQAKRDFLNAVLRQESGAVIADSEFANGEKQYFPQPGDDPGTIALKARNRKIAIQGIRQASAQPVPDIPPIQAPSGESGMPDFSQMSDEELEAIING